MTGAVWLRIRTTTLRSAVVVSRAAALAAEAERGADIREMLFADRAIYNGAHS
jgi:hypothetical protein